MSTKLILHITRLLSDSRFNLARGAAFHCPQSGSTSTKTITKQANIIFSDASPVTLFYRILNNTTVRPTARLQAERCTCMLEVSLPECRHLSKDDRIQEQTTSGSHHSTTMIALSTTDCHENIHPPDLSTSFMKFLFYHTLPFLLVQLHCVKIM